MKYRGVIVRGTPLFPLEGLDYSITLYWVIMCRTWVVDGALGCLASEVVPGVRMYSLRKPWQTSSSRYFRKLLQWMVWCPLLS